MLSARARHALRSSNTATNRRGRLRFLKKGVEKTIVLCARKQQLPSGIGMPSRQARVLVARQEPLYLFLILFPEDRAGNIKQFTTASHDLPQSIEQALLLA